MTDQEQQAQMRAQNAGSANIQSGVGLAPGPASPSAPLTDEHINELAKVAQAAHNAELVAEEIIQVAPQYINDAKAFIAMFNRAFTIIRGIPR